MIKFNLIIFLITLLFLPSFNSAKEILIYADNISYDKDKNIIARDNAKIYKDNQLIISDLIIYNKNEKKIILPTKFTLKDKDNNYLSGSSGFLNEDLDYGEFNDVKIKLNDGSRIIGNKGKRNKHIDIITKGVYSPCKSRIKIGNFICPTWQLEAEKIIHDNKNLFLYQKHSKMRIINTPSFYIPYIVTPSPLRKDRKSGFLSPSLSLNFFDTKTSQSISFPYYFNIATDKELTFTPVFNYGGGVDSSQRFLFEYDQILSGGYLSSDLTFDSNFEYENNNKWLNDASLITNYKKNVNENYKFSAESALQTSQNYIQRTLPENDLSYKTSLSTSLKLEGFYLNKIDDYFEGSLNFYQTNQQNENNKKIPTVFPNIKYYTGNEIIRGNNISSEYQFYNIFRNINTDIHSKRQQKISHTLNLNKSIIKYNSRISFNSQIYNQIYNTEDKLIETERFHSGSLYRLFPIVGIDVETPFKLKRNFLDLIITPNTQIVISPGISNSNEISNEDSSNNSFTIKNSSKLSRFTGTDKLDNSKRLKYGITVKNERIKLSLTQLYEFTNNSNYHFEQGNDNNLSDLLGSIEYNLINNFDYSFRYDVIDEFLKEQNINTKIMTKIGDLELSYLDQNSKINNKIKNDTETLNYGLLTKKFLNYSKIEVAGLYDLKKEINTEYKIGYSYFDECFGINLDFYRKSYEEDNLKPQDILTLMFSFKNIGSYKSTNLAVSENDKQEIEWEGENIDNSQFTNYE